MRSTSIGPAKETTSSSASVGLDEHRLPAVRRRPGDDARQPGGAGAEDGRLLEAVAEHHFQFFSRRLTAIVSPSTIALRPRA